VRSPGDLTHPPLRVVLDSQLRMSPDAKLLQETGPDEAGGAVHIVSHPGPEAARYRALQNAGALLHAIRPGEDGRPALREVASWLFELGVRRLLIEAGPTLLESWLQADLTDQIQVYTGDVSGGEGVSLGKWLDPERLDGIQHSEVGRDARIDAFLKR